MDDENVSGLKSSRCTNPSTSVNLTDQIILLLREYLNPEVSAEYPDTFLTSYTLCMQHHEETHMVPIGLQQ